MTPRREPRARTTIRAASWIRAAIGAARIGAGPTGVGVLGVVGVVLAVGVLVVAGPGIGSAAADASTVLAQPPAGGAQSFDAVLTNIRNVIMGLAAGLATVFITIGAVLYMSAGGDLGQVERAKTAFRSAGYGYAIAVLAPLVVSVLSGIVGAG